MAPEQGTPSSRKRGIDHLRFLLAAGATADLVGGWGTLVYREGSVQDSNYASQESTGLQIITRPFVDEDDEHEDDEHEDDEGVLKRWSNILPVPNLGADSSAQVPPLARTRSSR